MGLLDKWKDVLGLGKKKEEKKETKKDKPKKDKPKRKKISNREKFRKIENIHKKPSPIVDDSGDLSVNRKKHRRSLLDEAKNG
jgi:hypothetical protein